MKLRLDFLVTDFFSTFWNIWGGFALTSFINGQQVTLNNFKLSAYTPDMGIIFATTP